MCGCVYAHAHTHTPSYMRGGQSTACLRWFYPHFVGPGDQTQVIRLGRKYVFLLSKLVSQEILLLTDTCNVPAMSLENEIQRAY